MSKDIRILVADDHPIFRNGLKAVIESDANLKVIAEAKDGEAAFREIERLEPDVAVLDVNMPKMDGLAVARRLQAKNLPTHAIFLTMYTDEAIFNAALDADVKGFIVKDGAANDIITCIKSVMNGQSFFSAVLSHYLLDKRRKKNSRLDALTTSELRILRLIAEGKTSREIAEELFISVRTVEHHREHTCVKLDLKGKNALLTFALTNKSEILTG